MARVLGFLSNIARWAIIKMQQIKQVPPGISFGDRVLVVPGIASQFTHSGDIQSLLEAGSYSWISRGDAIAEFFIEGSFSGNFLIGIIKAPINSQMIIFITTHAVKTIPSFASKPNPATTMT